MKKVEEEDQLPQNIVRTEAQQKDQDRAMTVKNFILEVLSNSFVRKGFPPSPWNYIQTPEAPSTAPWRWSHISIIKGPLVLGHAVIITTISSVIMCYTIRRVKPNSDTTQNSQITQALYFRNSSSLVNYKSVSIDGCVYSSLVHCDSLSCKQPDKKNSACYVK